MKKESENSETTPVDIKMPELVAQEKLMRAAQKFSLAFDQDRRWADNQTRLSYTLLVWRELASAALEFSEKLSQQP